MFLAGLSPAGSGAGRDIGPVVAHPSLDERLWLVIDDVHELDPEASRQLELLVMRAPPAKPTQGGKRVTRPIPRPYGTSADRSQFLSGSLTRAASNDWVIESITADTFHINPMEGTTQAQAWVAAIQA